MTTPNLTPGSSAEAAQSHTLEPAIYDAGSLYGQLGYENVTDRSLEFVERANAYIAKTMLQIEDPDVMLFTKWIDAPERHDLPQPVVQALEKEGQRYLSVTFGDTTLILEDHTTTTRMKYAHIYNAFIIKHALVRNGNNQVIDLMSLRQGNAADNLFMFSGLPSGFEKERTYGLKGEEINLPGQVLLTMPVRQSESGQLEWDQNNFRYLFLHENGHAALAEYDQEQATSMPQQERNANAHALQTSKAVNRIHPEASFFDPQIHREWIEEQLTIGYDAKTLKRNNANEIVFDNMCSNAQRAALRQRPGPA